MDIQRGFIQEEEISDWLEDKGRPKFPPFAIQISRGGSVRGLWGYPTTGTPTSLGRCSSGETAWRHEMSF